MAITILCMLIASPHTHLYDEVLVYIAAAVTIPILSLPKLFKIRPLSFKLWCLLLVLYPLLGWLCYVALMLQGLLSFTQILITNLILLLLATLCWLQTSSENSTNRG